MMQRKEASFPLRMRINSGVEEYNFICSAQYQNRKMRRGGRNEKKTRKNDALNLLVDPSIRQKVNKKTWVKKEELKEKFPLAMCNQEKSQTWENEKLECNASIKGHPKQVWMKKEDDLLSGSRFFVSLQ